MNKNYNVIIRKCKKDRSRYEPFYDTLEQWNGANCQKLNFFKHVFKVMD